MAITRWTDVDDQELASLWEDGHSTAEIGRRLGKSKNSIVGRSHRLHLTGRASPILRYGPVTETARQFVPVPPKVTLPALISEECRPIRDLPIPAPMPMPMLVAPREPRPVAEPPRLDTSSTCCWPMGEPRTKTFRFCGDAPVRGRPYCPEHAGVAYVRIRQREEAA